MDFIEALSDNVRVLEIEERTLATPELLHLQIARALDFPAYYGANLSALSDCLEDLDVPTRIVVVRDDAAYQHAWLDGFIKVIRRCANENPDLELVVEEHNAPGATLDDILAKLERIEHRLDAIQAQPKTQASTPAPAAAAIKPTETCRNLASGSDGDRFECGACGCRVSDYLEDSRMLFDGLKYCPQCGREVTNPEGSNALGWVGELI